MDPNETKTRPVEGFSVDLSAEESARVLDINARAIASQAYLYALPAYLHMRQLTEFIQGRQYLCPGEPAIGGWFLVRKLSDPKTDNRYPNVDTLYGAAYLLLDQHGPVVLTVPAIADRYFSVALHDAYFNCFAIVGTSSGDTGGVSVLIAPPGWSGGVPEGVDRVIEAPTPIINLYQRIFVHDEAEYAHLHELQDAISLKPLGADAFPALDLAAWKIPGMRDVSDPLVMFGHAKRYIALNGWPVLDDGLNALFDTAGVGPASELPADDRMIDAVRIGASDAQAAIDARLSSGPFRSGWNVPDPAAGVPGPHILSRAAVQVSQIGSLPPTEAIYFFAHLDGAGGVLSGDNVYGMTFAPGALPPLGEHGFWSITMYGTDAFLVENPIDRYVFRPDTPGIVYGPDGSLTVRLQADEPVGDARANWLPTPRGGFIVGFRAYRPTGAVQDGTWFPPAITQVA